MAQKVVETGDMLYWMKNYGEYMRLVFSNPVTAVAYTVPMVMVIIMVIEFKRSIYNRSVCCILFIFFGNVQARNVVWTSF